MRMYLIKLSRTVLGVEQFSHVMLLSTSREAAEKRVREIYELGAEYNVREMMSWEPGKPVMVLGSVMC